MPRAFSWTSHAVAALLVALTLWVAPATAQQMPVMQLGMPAMPEGQTELIRTLLPSVVNITIRRDVEQPESGMNASGGAPASQRFYGSGFVIDPSGIIATNYHVVDGAWIIEATFSDGTRLPAHLFKASRLIDIALVKVAADHPLPALRWGDSQQLQIGEPVFAIGNALGVGISVSGGIVSALHRDIMDSPYDDFIQTDASINHGNSGGPLFNMRGEVVGMDTALISPTSGSSGVGFAIPSRSVQTVIHRLIDYGWLRPGWIGVKVQGITPDMAQALGMKQPDGSIVANVTEGSPAADAGVRVGDVIVRVDQATPNNERELLRAIATSPIGHDVTLGLWREGREQTLNVTVREWPRAQWDTVDVPVSMTVSHHHVQPDLGLALATLDDASRARFGVVGTRPGTLITGVMPGSDAAQRGLVAGDVILRVQEKPVTTVAEAQAAFAAIRGENRQFALVLIEPKVHKTPGPEWIALRISDD